MLQSIKRTLTLKKKLLMNDVSLCVNIKLVDEIVASWCNHTINHSTLANTKRQNAIELKTEMHLP